MARRRRQLPATRLPVHREGPAFEVEIDGERVPAYPGESVAAVLMAARTRVFTRPSRYNLARTLFCGMGLCHQCLVRVEGKGNVRACMTNASPDMKIETRIAQNKEDGTV